MHFNKYADKPFNDADPIAVMDRIKSHMSDFAEAYRKQYGILVTKIEITELNGYMRPSYYAEITMKK